MKFFIFVCFFLMLVSCGPQESEVQGLNVQQQNAVAAGDEKIVLYLATMSKGTIKCAGCEIYKNALTSAGIITLNNGVPSALASKYSGQFSLKYCHTNLETNTVLKNMDVKDCVEATKQIASIVDKEFKEFASVPFFGLYMEKSKVALPSYSTMYVDGDKSKGLMADDMRPVELVNMINDIVKLRDAMKQKQPEKQKETPKTQVKTENETLPDAKIPDAKSSAVNPVAENKTAPETKSENPRSTSGQETSGFLSVFANFLKGFFEGTQAAKNK